MEVVLLFLSFLFFLLAVLFMLLMNGGELPFFKSKTRPTLRDLSKMAADEFALEYNNYRQESLRRGGLK
jgi:hypothetical protein